MQKITCFYRVVFEIIFLGGTLLYSDLKIEKRLENFFQNFCSQFFFEDVSKHEQAPKTRFIESWVIG